MAAAVVHGLYVGVAVENDIEHVHQRKRQNHVAAAALYDALYDVLGKDAAARLKEKEVIEVVPLAYMRGRTLDSSFIILDEAQNTTREQMKMFLTRMGFGSRVVVTGDITQIDLPRGKVSGLTEAVRILKPVDDIEFCYLKDTDVVRHELVKKIIKAYDEYYDKHQTCEEEQ